MWHSTNNDIKAHTVQQDHEYKCAECQKGHRKEKSTLIGVRIQNLQNFLKSYWDIFFETPNSRRTDNTIGQWMLDTWQPV